MSILSAMGDISMICLISFVVIIGSVSASVFRELLSKSISRNSLRDFVMRIALNYVLTAQ